MSLIYLLFLLKFCVGFNLDVQNGEVFENPLPDSGDRSSYFGYSVALYVSGNSSVLLIGAPRANSTRPADVAEGVIEPGAVYQCHLDREDGCVEWLIDGAHDNRIFGKDSKIQQIKDHAWLGGSISVQNTTTRPRVVVCAPGWKKKELQYYSFGEKWYMTGMCYSGMVNDSSFFDRAEARRHFPFVVSRMTVEVGKDKLYYYGMGQAGFSAHLTPDQGDLVLGAPGVLHWTGSAISINESMQNSPYAALIPDVLRDYNFVFSDYFGYAVTSGYYFDIGKRTYAASAPRSADSHGKVFLFDFPQSNRGKLLLKTALSGEQLGEYFGSTLASCDINNDGRDDLIVGAPQWSTYVDEGRVYAFVSKGHFKFERQSINGEVTGGRFGTAVVCLGDLDYDGHADIAVGAPYENENRGSIYVYSGTPDGLSSKYSQKIEASEFGSELRGFGFSISEPRDVDGNGYGDLAVGAYLSGHVVLIKVKPSITLEIKLTVPGNSTPLTENSTEFAIEACSIYDGVFAPNTYKVIKEFEIDKTYKRCIIYQKGRLYGNIYKVSTILKKGERKCIVVKINLKKNIQNVIDPIEIDGQIYTNEKSSCENCPVVNPKTSRTNETLKLSYVLDVCGSDNICTSDLQVNVTSDLGDGNKYIIGSNSKVNLVVFVKNTLEPAYKAQVHIYVPRPMVLARVPMECHENIQKGNKTFEVVCDIGSPLLDNKSILMQLDLNGLQFSDRFKDLTFNVTTQSTDKNLSNNVDTLRINFDVDADLMIVGKSYEAAYYYFDKDVIEGKVTKFSLNHVYELWKLGVTPIETASILISVPILWKRMVVTKVNRILGLLDNQKFNCEMVVDNEFFALDNSNMTTLPVKKAFIIDTSSPNITCQTYRCNIGPFIEHQSMAKIIVSIDFYLFNAISGFVEELDTIFFVSEGFLQIVTPTEIHKFLKNSSTHSYRISTKILLRPEPKVPISIIIYSSILGILLLIIITFIFNKYGFFNRSNKEDLVNLNSSEMVNQDTYHHENSGISETEMTEFE